MSVVLVTGAAGFLGSHLCKRHLDAGDLVIGVDDFSSSKNKSAHLKALQEHVRFQFIKANVCDDHRSWGGGWNELDRKLDLIYNFACPASPPVYQSMPVHTMMTCTVGTANVLDLADDHGAIVVHASTSEVYGDPDVSPQSEAYRGNVNSYGPRSCYDEGKRAAEALCYDFLNAYDVDVRLVRIFNTYGPNMDPKDGRVVSNFICQALKREPLTIYGKGEQTRSFCYVDDLIDGIVAMGGLEHNPHTPVNLGNPHEFTIEQLATYVIRCTGLFGNSQDYKPFPIDDPLQRKPDITLAREILKWEPKIGLEEGLLRTIEYFRGCV